MGISPYFGGEGYRIVIGGANPLTLSSLLFPSLLLKVFFSHYPLSLSQVPSPGLGRLRVVGLASHTL